VRTLAAHFRRRYGAGPGHLVVSLAGLAVAVYGLVRIAQHPGAGRVFAYLAAAVVVHDLVLLPLYTLAYRGAWRAGRIGADPRRLAVFRHLLVPVVIAGTLLLVWFPLVLALPRFHPILTTSVDVFAPRWALVTAALFAASAVAYAARALRARGWPATGA
jgi:hypothetical protein